MANSLRSLRCATRDARPTGEEAVLCAFEWDSARQKFGERTTLLPNFFAQNIPQRLRGGDWLMLGKHGGGAWEGMKAARSRDGRNWSVSDLPDNIAAEEPEWYQLEDGTVLAHLRTRPLRRLLRSVSADEGRTWSDLVVTNFPEASARHHALRLSNGLYALVVNPNTSGQRLPLSIAVSRDGWVYDRIANARADIPAPRGEAEKPSFNYMRGWEHDGNLYVIYSINQQDIGLTTVPVAALARL